MKIGIVGTGAVGSATAFSLIMSGVAQQIVLIDINQLKAQAEAMDITHAAPFGGGGLIMAGNYSDLTDCQIVIVTAGANQKEGETRLDLLARNVEIFADVIPQIARFAPQTILLITANPADIMTEVALKLSGFAKEKVIGSGTVLDTSRFRTLLAQYLEVSAKSVHADVLGEHGDSEVLVWSNAEAGTLLLDEFAAGIGKTLDEDKKAQINDEVVKFAYKIIQGKGATSYGIAGALTHICRAIANNDNSILTVSSHHADIEGITDVCLSVPTVINKNGIHHVIIPNLSAEEHQKLYKSAVTMRDFTDKALEILQNKDC